MTKEQASTFARKYPKSYGAELQKKHLEEWHGSGLSMSEYCRRNGLAISTLSKWNQKQDTPTGLKLKPLKTGRMLPPLLPPTFALEIRLLSGIQIRLANADDTTAFKRILEVVQSCS